MTLAPKLSIKQTTALVMTPQLQQAIKLLQLSNQELAQFVEHEIEENPLLERESTEGGFETESPAETGADGSEPDSQAAAEDGGDVEAGPGDGDGDGPRGDDDGMEPATPDSAELSSSDHLPDAGDQPLDTDFDNEWTNDDRPELETPAPEQFSDWGAGGYDGPGFDIAERLSGEESLRDHLTRQANCAITDPQARLIAAALIDGVDETGYLTVAIGEIAERLGVEAAAVEVVLTVLQGFEPTGVFARDLAECLAIQLRDRDRFDPAMAALVENLDRLAKRDVPGLKRVCGVDDEDLADMVAEIRSLDPKPGLTFGSEEIQTVVPDILVRARPDGTWQIELNPDTLPRVLVNQTYFAEVKSAARSKADRDYLTERMQSANWLVRALHQRATTILKVATELVRIQGAFLHKGVRHLKPLTLRDVADAIGMHESTVSRVTTAKYMATPRGVFELKYFFTAAIASNIGAAAHSAESVRQRIRDLVEAETRKSVLSDDKIVTLLSEEGIEIARRTVAKYRESMRIPSSSQRRRDKAFSL